MKTFKEFIAENPQWQHYADKRKSEVQGKMAALKANLDKNPTKASKDDSAERERANLARAKRQKEMGRGPSW